MSDMFAKDTRQAMENFKWWMDDIEHTLKDEFQDSYTTFINEVDMFIDRYEEKIGELEELQEKLEKGEGVE